MHAREARRAEMWGAWLGAAAAALPMALFWGFSVDDALITARVAAHIANGFGHRFNIGGPIVDAVTPLGFEYVLAPFAGRGPLAALYFAKWLGAACGVAVGAWIGRRVATSGNGRERFFVLAPLAVSSPFAAWCVCGMETGVVLGLATIALSSLPLAALSAGLAAALRPELVPYATVLAVGRGIAARRSPAHLARALLSATTPAAVVAIVRKAVFGHAAPLAVWAKPSDFAHGARYLAVCLLWTGAPLLVAAPRALAKLDRESRAVLAALAAHSAAIVVVGGDWMPLCRLFVPALPALFLVGARLAPVTRPWSTWLRAGAATSVSVLLLVKQAPAARHVLDQRLALVADARPALAGAERVATVDVGWVGAATDATVVDLAGVTDDFVAHLPGGHTSKHLPSRFVETRNIDALVLLCDDPKSTECGDDRWDRVVEYRVARQSAELGFVVRAKLELRGTAKQYLVLRRKESVVSDQN